MSGKSLPSISRCWSDGQLAANSSTSESQTVRLAVRKSLRRRGRLRARCWKHPALLCSVGHQPRSSSSSILSTHRPNRKTGVTQSTHQSIAHSLTADQFCFALYLFLVIVGVAYLQPETSSARPRSVKFLQRHRSSEHSERQRAASILATTS